MSKAALLIRDFGPQKVEAISELRKELGVSMSDINRGVLTGAPLVVRKLFDRASPEFPRKLLRLMSRLEALNVAFAVYELLDGQTFALPNKYYEITVVQLKNMIDTREQSLEQQRTLARLQDGV